MGSGVGVLAPGLSEFAAEISQRYKDFTQYLTDLEASDLSGRAKCEAIGFNATSIPAYKKLLAEYGVVTPVHLPKLPSTSIKKAHRRHVDVETAVVFGDSHGTEVDKRAFAVMVEVIRDLKPEYGFINGDFVSFDSISRFSKAPEIAMMLNAEVEQANKLLDMLHDASPNTKWTYVEGNHEVRLREYIRRNAKELHSLKDPRTGKPMLNVSNLFMLKERGITYVPQVGKSGYTRYGAITIGHFDKYSSIPGAVAKWFLEHRNETVIQGHTHKRCQLDRRFPDGREITAVEHGCLCRLEPEYVTDPDWAQGFVIITKRKDTDRFHINAVRIVDHEALVGDTLYSG